MALLMGCVDKGVVPCRMGRHGSHRHRGCTLLLLIMTIIKVHSRSRGHHTRSRGRTGKKAIRTLPRSGSDKILQRWIIPPRNTCDVGGAVWQRGWSDTETRRFQVRNLSRFVVRFLLHGNVGFGDSALIRGIVIISSKEVGEEMVFLDVPVDGIHSRCRRLIAVRRRLVVTAIHDHGTVGVAAENEAIEVKLVSWG